MSLQIIFIWTFFLTRFNDEMQRLQDPSGEHCPQSRVDTFNLVTTVAQKYKLLYFTLNIRGLRSGFPSLHTEIPCLLRQFLAFAVTFLSGTVNSLVCTSQYTHCEGEELSVKARNFSLKAREKARELTMQLRNVTTKARTCL